MNDYWEIVVILRSYEVTTPKRSGFYALTDNFFSKRRTEHVCPFCGTTMYETGGGPTFMGKIRDNLLIYSFIAVILLAIIGEIQMGITRLLS